MEPSTARVWLGVYKTQEWGAYAESLAAKAAAAGGEAVRLSTRAKLLARIPGLVVSEEERTDSKARCEAHQRELCAFSKIIGEMSKTAGEAAKAVKP